jgi:hypothetical protein
VNRGLVLAEWMRAKQSLRAAEILGREPALHWFIRDRILQEVE